MRTAKQRRMRGLDLVASRCAEEKREKADARCRRGGRRGPPCTRTCRGKEVDQHACGRRGAFCVSYPIAISREERRTHEGMLPAPNARTPLPGRQTTRTTRTTMRIVRCVGIVFCVCDGARVSGIYRAGTALSSQKNKNRRSKAVVPDVIHLSLAWQPRRSLGAPPSLASCRPPEHLQLPSTLQSPSGCYSRRYAARAKEHQSLSSVLIPWSYVDQQLHHDS